jgi:hypothetical protein
MINCALSAAAGAPKTGEVTKCACGIDDTNSSSSPYIDIMQGFVRMKPCKLTSKGGVDLRERVDNGITEVGYKQTVLVSTNILDRIAGKF